MKLPIYLDYHATTPVDPEVFKTMAPFFTEIFGNAASRNHEYGWTAESAVEFARKQVGELIGASEKEFVFTSGATESNNLALQGVADMYGDKGNHIITTAIEHKAVLDTCHALEKKGVKVDYGPIDDTGRVKVDELAKRITDKTILDSIMFANNELGAINPTAEIGKLG